SSRKDTRMIGRKTEAAYWIAAPIDDPELDALVAEHDRLETEQKQLGQTPTTGAVGRILSGTPAEAAVADAAAEQQQAKLRAKAIAAVHEAVRAAAKRVVVYCGRNRHHLMAEANRVDQTLLTEAREHVVELAPFAPDYAPERIAIEATKPQLDAWRRSRELNDQ